MKAALAYFKGENDDRGTRGWKKYPIHVAPIQFLTGPPIITNKRIARQDFFSDRHLPDTTIFRTTSRMTSSKTCLKTPKALEDSSLGIGLHNNRIRSPRYN